MKTQVSPRHYHHEYDFLERWVSYWHQISEVLALKPKRVLEIGIGNGLVTHYLRKEGVDVVTADVDARLKPDVVADVTDLRMFKSGSFDLVMCCEVLEHLPFVQFDKALGEIHRVARQRSIISLPHFGLTFAFSLYLPVIGWKKFSAKFPFPMKHVFNGEHYWEIGKRGYPLGLIRHHIQKAGFDIAKSYNVFENPYHRFFILKKRPEK